MDLENRLSPLPTIHPWSIESMGHGLQAAAYLSSVVSGSMVYINAALLFPFRLSIPITVLRTFTYNGTAVAGTIDVGVYTDEGGTSNTLVRMFSSTPKAQSGTSVIQVNSALTGTTQIGPGCYYLAIAFSSGSATLFQKTISTLYFAEMYGARYIETGSATLPATISSFTLATLTQIPCFGISTRSFV